MPAQMDLSVVKPLLRRPRAGQALPRTLRRAALAAPGAARGPPRPGSRALPLDAGGGRTWGDAGRSRSRGRPTRTRHRRRRAAEGEGASPAPDRRATRRRTRANSAHLQARHARGLRNVRKSGARRNRTGTSFRQSTESQPAIPPRDFTLRRAPTVVGRACALGGGASIGTQSAHLHDETRREAGFVGLVRASRPAMPAGGDVETNASHA